MYIHEQEIRRKANKESQDAKEELQRKQRIKEAEKKKREAEGDKIAKARVREKIEADKKARREKAEQEKARREGRAAQVAAPAAPSAPKPSADYTESRLRLQTPDRQNIMKKLPVETTLLEIASSIELETGIEVNNFAQNFPRKVFTREDFGNNLKELNLVPSASLIIG